MRDKIILAHIYLIPAYEPGVWRAVFPRCTQYCISPIFYVGHLRFPESRSPEVVDQATNQAVRLWNLRG